MATDEDRAHLVSALAITKPFTSTDANQSRLLWHPQVHQHYGERCLYFVLRLRDLQVSDSQPVMEALIHEAGVGTYSIYLLYGVYDVLIRTWVTATARARLEVLLDASVATVADWEEFQVEQIRYLWAGTYIPLTSRLIESHRQDIESVASFRGSPGAADSILSIAEKLFDDRILHVLPGRPHESIKFYVALQADPGGGTRTRGVEDLVSRLQASGLDSISLYSGIGFANHLLRCVASDFPTVLTTLGDLAPVAKQMNMRTTSMLIATTEVRESDVLLTNLNSANPVFAQIAGVIGPQYEDMLTVLSDEMQTDVSRIFRRYSVLLGTPCDELFIAILRSLLDQDISQLNRELSILLHFEFLLKEYLKAHLHKQFGDTMVAALARVGASMPKYKSEVGPEPDLDFLALGTAAQLTNRLVLDQEIEPPMVVYETLGEGWAGILETFTKRVRNPLAHGVVFTDSYRRRFLQMWRDNAELVCEICLLYTKLLGVADNDDDEL